jgi:hypothetical protein
MKRVLGIVAAPNPASTRTRDQDKEEFPLFA